MNRPFYVHTPRNGWGESLVPYCCPYTIRSTDKGREDLERLGTNRALADARCKVLNDAHETEMAFASGI